MKRDARPFVDLRTADAEPASLAEPGHFLGRFDPAALEREMEAAGILAALAGRGYPTVRLHVDRTDGGHRLRILPPRGEEPLVELRASESTVIVDEPVLRAQDVDLLYVLTVHWFTTQDPARPFSPARPRLPGQEHPGLGIGRRFYGRLMAWAHEWGKDALLNVPEYFHNAVFYATMFRFVSPARQGRFEALRRDLAPLHVCAASAAADEGRVVEEPGARPFRWEAAEMISPVTSSLKAALESDEYAAAVARARDAARFRVVDRP
ncbi:MAG TPA: hypothetical protein VMT87_04960 [Vicinamibacteria bacterium]|nr:hypothetical protein [Vicinamibacteria bacterium]